MSEFVDAHELRSLSHDLSTAGLRAALGARPVVSKGAHNVTMRARETASGLRHAPAYPRSITYDMDDDPLVIRAEIGPDKEKPQGALGNLIEFGSAKNPPHNDLGGALDEEGPRFEQYMGEMAARTIWPL